MAPAAKKAFLPFLMLTSTNFPPPASACHRQPKHFAEMETPVSAEGMAHRISSMPIRNKVGERTYPASPLSLAQRSRELAFDPLCTCVGKSAVYPPCLTTDTCIVQAFQEHRLLDSIKGLSQVKHSQMLP